MLRELFRQVEAQVVSNGRNEIHPTWGPLLAHPCTIPLRTCFFFFRLDGPRDPRDLAAADGGGCLLGLLPRHALPARPAARRARHPLGRHGRLRHLVPQASHAALAQGQGGQEDLRLRSEYSYIQGDPTGW